MAFNYTQKKVCFIFLLPWQEPFHHSNGGCVQQQSPGRDQAPSLAQSDVRLPECSPAATRQRERCFPFLQNFNCKTRARANRTITTIMKHVFLFLHFYFKHSSIQWHECTYCIKTWRLFHGQRCFVGPLCTSTRTISNWRLKTWGRFSGRSLRTLQPQWVREVVMRHVDHLPAALLSTGCHCNSFLHSMEKYGVRFLVNSGSG